MVSKLHLSDEELNFLQQTRPFELKVSVAKKISGFYAAIIDDMKIIPAHQRFSFPSEINITDGKISKGENYNGYPYYILDFPKHFQKENIFSFRAMLWWGHHWSVHLHLKGKFLNEYKNPMLKNMAAITNKNFQLAIADDEWNYVLNETNFISINPQNMEQVKAYITQMSYLKISAFTSLNEQAIHRWILNAYAELLELLG